MSSPDKMPSQPVACVFCGRETTATVNVPLTLGGRYSTKRPMATAPGHESCLRKRLLFWFIGSAGLLVSLVGALAKWGMRFMSPGETMVALFLSVFLVPYGGGYLLFEWLVAGPARGYAPPDYR